jgi:hypothetical protein
MIPDEENDQLPVEKNDIVALISRKRLHVELNELVVVCLSPVECFIVVTSYI